MRGKENWHNSPVCTTGLNRYGNDLDSTHRFSQYNSRANLRDFRYQSSEANSTPSLMIVVKKGSPIARFSARRVGAIGTNVKGFVPNVDNTACESPSF